MKRILIILLVFNLGSAFAQQPAMINEDFYQKMMDFNLAWTDFDMPTKLNNREARFTAFQCKYFSTASPAKPSDCSKGRINIEVSKGKYVPYFEFPELPSCSVLKLGIQAGDKAKVCGIAIERLENDSWIQIDETDIDARAKCIFWEPKNIKSDSPLKFRLVANKEGSVFLTDVYAEGF
jgi:hypothetical protein